MNASELIKLYVSARRALEVDPGSREPHVLADLMSRLRYEPIPRAVGAVYEDREGARWIQSDQNDMLVNMVTGATVYVSYPIERVL